MISIALTGSDNELSTLYTAFAVAYGYQAATLVEDNSGEIAEEVNTETIEQFTLRMISEYAMGVADSYRDRLAGKAAVDAARAEGSAVIIVGSSEKLEGGGLDIKPG